MVPTNMVDTVGATTTTRARHIGTGVALAVSKSVLLYFHANYHELKPLIKFLMILSLIFEATNVHGNATSVSHLPG